MNKKEKLIGSIGILILAVIFLITGYFLSNKEEDNYNEVFVQFDKKEKKSTVLEQGENKADNTLEHKVIQREGEEETNIAEENTMVEQLELSNIKVDIKGAVKYPGIYTLKEGSRTADLIDLAGGLTIEADYDSVYLSKKLCDEDFIYILKKGEEKREDLPQGNTAAEGQNIQVDKYNSNSLGKVNINTATLEELKTLPGIGDVKAQSIINYRNSHGKFSSIDELMDIDGIGEKTIIKLKNMLIF